MNEHRSLNSLVDAGTLAQVEALALRHGISSDAYAADAIRRVAEDETEFWTFVQEGIDAADRGDFVPNEQVMATLAAMRAKYEARCG